MYIFYNANPSGKSTGDCVIRAIATITGKSWVEVHEDLSFYSRKMYDMMNFLNSFNQFRQNFNGNPQQMVQNLISSGQMSQNQYNQLSNMANQIMPFVKR